MTMSQTDLVERLKDYGLTLDPDVVICDRRLVDEAAAELASLRAELEQVKKDRDHLDDELIYAKYEPWPVWATEVLRVIRERSGYDGYDDAENGVDMPEELDECMSELENEAERWKSRAESAEAELLQATDKLAELEQLRREAVDAMKPFGTSYVAQTVDGNGWTSGVEKERIHVWFGPSDFRTARAFVEKHQ